MSSVEGNTLPKRWIEKKFGEVCKVINGRAYKKTELLSEGKYKVLRVGNLFTNNSWYWSDLELKEDKYISNGDLIYAWSASFGPRVWDGEKVIYHYHIWKIVNGIEVSKDFLYNWLHWKTETIKKENTSGATMIHVTKGMMESLVIQFPDIEEQKRIVDKIDTLFAKIDKAISLTEESLKQAKDLLPSLLKEVFENLDSPKSSLSEFCSDAKKHMVGGPFGSNLKATEYVDKGYPIIRLQNVNRFDFIEKNIKFVTQEKAEFLKSHSYVSGDIVLTKLGAPLGKCCIVKKVCGIDRGVISADIVRIRINEKENIKEFVVAGINSEVIRKQMVSKTQGTTRPRVTLKELRQMILPKPSYEEQLIIVEKIKYLKDESKQTQSKLEEQLRYLKQLKSSILSKAFQGEL